MNVLEGKLVAEGMKIGIVCARFNEFITSKLLGGAMDALVRHGVADSDVDVAWVPGAFEIPLAAQKMAATGNTMRSFALVRLSKVLHLIMIMYVQKYQKVLQLFHYLQVFRFSSVF